MAGSIAKMKEAVKKIDAAQPGYDQSQRWTFYSKGKVIKGKECDCSSCCGAIAQMGGYPVDLTGTFFTGNFNDKMKAAGFKILPFKMNDWKVGDFINAPGAHVEFCYSKTQWYSARNDERGKSTGGKAGDQGGRENVGFGKPYDMSKGGKRKAYIVRPPVPTTKPPVTAPTDALFRFGQANLMAQRFGGLDDTTPLRGKFLEEEMKCSVYSLCEVTKIARTAIRKEMGGLDRWLVQEINLVCVLWDSTRWTYKSTDRVSFGSDIHGAVRQELVHKPTGLVMDVIAIHVRPNDALRGSDEEKLRIKLADIQKGLDLRRKGVCTVFAGDFNTSHARKYIEDRGFKAANDHVDTVDKVGDQKLDGVYVSIDPVVTVRGWSLKDPGKVSDHKAILGNLTLPAATPKGEEPSENALAQHHTGGYEQPPEG